MTNSADPDQLATDLDLHCLQRQGISGFSRTRVNNLLKNKDSLLQKMIDTNILLNCFYIITELQNHQLFEHVG